MTAGHEKAGAATPAAFHTTNADHDRIPPAGFTAIRHLLDAARQLHQMAELPLDAIQAAKILICRITADVARLGGGE